MADISKIKLNNTAYMVKDVNARTRISALESTINSSLTFKGTVSTATGITGLTDYKVGWCYKASADFSITGIGTIEAGDMLICISDYNSAYSASDWTVVQSNIDVYQGATSSAPGVKGLVPAAASTQRNNILRGDGIWTDQYVKDYVTAGKKAGTNLGMYSTAEGYDTVASGDYSHAEGRDTMASGDYSHAEGYSTIAQKQNQHVFGRYNIADTTDYGKYIEIVGNGTDLYNRNNARTLDWNGNETLAGTLTLGADPTTAMQSATKQYVDNNALTTTFTATLAAASWSGTSAPYTYSLSLSSLKCGSNGTVPPIIYATSNIEQYSYITSAVATANTGIVFTSDTKPTSAINLLVVDIR